MNRTHTSPRPWQLALISALIVGSAAAAPDALALTGGARGRVSTASAGRASALPGLFAAEIGATVATGGTAAQLATASAFGSVPAASGTLDGCGVKPSAPTGLAVRHLLSSNCALALSWSAGAAGCPGASVTYNVYRGTNPAFACDASSLVASGLAATSFVDGELLSSGGSYYYVVRSVDSESGEEENLAVAAATLPTPPVAGIFVESFETVGQPLHTGWTVSVISPPSGTPDLWVPETVNPYGGTGARFVADWPPDSGSNAGGDHAYVSPTIMIGDTSVLSFWHTWSFENQNPFNAPVPPPSYDCGIHCWDGGVLEYRQAGGPWTRIDSFLSGGYNGALDAAAMTDNPLGRNVPAWVGGTIPPRPYIQTTVALGALAGAGPVQLRWRLAADTGNYAPGALGWYVDQVEVSDVLFSDSCTLFCTAPAAPALDAATGSCDGVDLAWTPGQTGRSAAFHVYRAPSAGGPMVRLTAAPVADPAYSDDTALPGVEYSYVVTGTCDAAGAYESGAGPALSAAGLTPPPAPPAPQFARVGAAAVDVAWSAMPEASAYDVYRVDGGCSGTETATHQDLDATAATSYGLAAVSTYGYRLVAANACGRSAAGACASVTTLAAPPWTPQGGSSGAALQAVRQTADGRGLRLTWDAACAAPDYEIVHGTEAQLPAAPGGTFGVSGVVCSVGASGTTDWSDSPDAAPGSMVWFLVVATDGVRTEGPWGLDGAGLERSGPGPGGSSGDAGACPRDDKLLTSTCGR